MKKEIIFSITTVVIAVLGIVGISMLSSPTELPIPLGITLAILITSEMLFFYFERRIRIRLSNLIAITLAAGIFTYCVGIMNLFVVGILMGITILCFIPFIFPIKIQEQPSYFELIAALSAIAFCLANYFSKAKIEWQTVAIVIFAIYFYSLHVQRKFKKKKLRELKNRFFFLFISCVLTTVGIWFGKYHNYFPQVLSIAVWINVIQISAIVFKKKHLQFIFQRKKEEELFRKREKERMEKERSNYFNTWLFENEDIIKKTSKENVSSEEITDEVSEETANQDSEEITDRLPKKIIRQVNS